MAAGLLSSLLLSLALLSCARVSAQEARAVQSRITQSQMQSSVDAELEERLARDWGLRADEWARYRQLMQGPLGVYSPNVDPLTALGIEAQSDEERRRYAELQVQAEGRRVEKLLAYQRAYDEAWQRLYPGLRPLRPAAAETPANANALANVDDRIAVFVKEDCPPCDQRVKQLQASARPFDVYMVDSQHDDLRIRRWATRVGIDPQQVRARTITLNHDDGRWLSIGGQGALPAVLVARNGQWQRE